MKMSPSARGLGPRQKVPKPSGPLATPSMSEMAGLPAGDHEPVGFADW